VNIPQHCRGLQHEDIMESFSQGNSCPGLQILYLPTGCAPDRSPLTPWFASTFASVSYSFPSPRRALHLSAAGWGEGEAEEDGSGQSCTLTHLHQ